MKQSTKIKGQLLADSRFHSDILSVINNQMNDLCNEIEGKLIFENIHAAAPRLLTWDDGEQYRIDFTLRPIGKITRVQVYEIINKVRAQKLTFTT